MRFETVSLANSNNRDYCMTVEAMSTNSEIILSFLMLKDLYVI